MSGDMLDAALAYSRMKWRIFPCHSIVNGACACGGQRDKKRRGDWPVQITRKASEDEARLEGSK